jgi:pimeloyl-ACP methyl ester carboxylesterase
MTQISYRSTDVNGLKVFYRESGPSGAPKLLLLHGYPSASHMFRDLIPQLAGRLQVIAPDLLGFGQSDMPSRDSFSYTFDALTDVLDGFTDAVGFDRYAVYVFDYGAPTGFRLAVRHPERITAIITQNGNAYEEGLSDGWNPIQAYWKEPTQANRDAIRSLVQPETTIWQYTHGVPDPALVSPDGYTLDNNYLARPGAHEIQLDLFLDYANNIKLYPQFQEYFRTRQPPLLAIWGRNDPFFLPAGAEAFNETSPPPTSDCSTPAISRSRPTRLRLRQPCGSSSPTERRDPGHRQPAPTGGTAHEGPMCAATIPSLATFLARILGPIPPP